MNGLLAVFTLSLSYRAGAAPAHQEFQSQAYHTQSVYPIYNIQHQSLPINAYSNQFSQSGYGQRVPFPHLNSQFSNSSEQTKLETDYRAGLEKIEKVKEGDQATVKVDQKANVKLISLADQSSVNAVNPFIANAKTASRADCAKSTIHNFGATSFEHHANDPIFGPEVGSKYEIHYTAEHLPSFPSFSSYSAFPVQAAFPAHQSPFLGVYSGFPAYAGYPAVFSGSDLFFGVGGVAAGLTPVNGNKIYGIPVQGPEISTVNSIEGVSKYPAGGAETSSEVLSETTSESNIGEPPSIDGPAPSSFSSSSNQDSSKSTTRKK